MNEQDGRQAGDAEGLGSSTRLFAFGAGPRFRMLQLVLFMSGHRYLPSISAIQCFRLNEKVDTLTERDLIDALPSRDREGEIHKSIVSGGSLQVKCQ